MNDQELQLKRQLEMACDVIASTHEDVDLFLMVATLSSYRGWIVENVHGSGPVTPQTFVGWMESATREASDYPEPWAGKAIELFDQILIDAVREDNMQPATVADVLDEWVEESKAEIRELHDLPEGVFGTSGGGV